ncbi:MAG: N-acetyl-gamma-glutamyl-phosphate reductase [Gemmiger sp.]|jgi:N-acetyl-gamma-glutamyl-phosphate reductase|uniref:N-acetyl-gamma-glutamyl-phosphate reductase n=1 Tax=Gemmiger sp. TaxID=2049027 RepID=UPI00300EA597
MGKYKIFVDGSSGTTGLRIADRLAERSEFTILPISEAERKDVHARAAVINESDLSFLCLPDDAAREVVPLLRPDVRVLDTSTAHRTAPGWTYGLPELHGTREALRTATCVAVPGCHATGFIAPVAPLVELGLVPKTALLHCTSLTGYSGGGKKMIAQYETERTDPALNAPRPYGLALHHKHLPEMAAITGLTTPPTFVPVVADYYAGMETMIPLDLPALGLTAQQVADALADYYAGQKMISVHPLNEGTDGGFLAANKLAGLDRLEIFCVANPDGTQMELISLFDNLGKGSSGAAVQCMNLMLGLDETAGLAL